MSLQWNASGEPSHSWTYSFKPPHRDEKSAGSFARRRRGFYDTKKIAECKKKAGKNNGGSLINYNMSLRSEAFVSTLDGKSIPLTTLSL
jgi:hypothetical protein